MIVREAWPDKPLFVRIGGTERAGGEQNERGGWLSWGLEQSKIFSEAHETGVDLINVSSIGNPKQVIPTLPGYQVCQGLSRCSASERSGMVIFSYVQVHLADDIKKPVPRINVAAVGLIFDGKQTNDHLEEDKLDVIFLAQEFMRDPILSCGLLWNL